LSQKKLVAAILAQPHEDEPRLAYADWLDSKKNAKAKARAELIRLEIERFHAKPQPNDAMSWNYVKESRQVEIRDQYEDEWITALAFPANRKTKFRLSRGMVGRVTCTPRYFLDHAEECFAKAPITSALFNGLQIGNAKPLARSPYLSRLRDICLYPRETPAYAVERLFTDIPPGVQGITFHTYTIDWVVRHDDLIAEIVKLPSMSEVRCLRLRSAGAGDRAGKAIAESPYLDNLTFLDLRWNTISDAVLDQIKERFGDAVWRVHEECSRYTFGQIGWA